MASLYKLMHAASKLKDRQ